MGVLWLSSLLTDFWLLSAIEAGLLICVVLLVFGKVCFAVRECVAPDALLFSFLALWLWKNS